jgi:hypothetical protein
MRQQGRSLVPKRAVELVGHGLHQIAVHCARARRHHHLGRHAGDDIEAVQPRHLAVAQLDAHGVVRRQAAIRARRLV